VAPGTAGVSATVTVHAWPVSASISTPLTKAVYRLVEVVADGGQETESLFSP